MVFYRYTKSGYFAAIIGSLIGAITLIFLGAYLGGLYTKYFMPNASLDGLLPPIFGSFIGWWIGEVLGCWLALHWLGYRKAKKTAIHLAILTPCGIVTWIVFSVQVLTRISNYYPDFQRYLMPLSVSLTIIFLAWLARFNTKPLSPHKHNIY
jgi:hypothetical protein